MGVFPNKMMGVLTNKIEREEVKEGDHIYSWRRAYVYAHHGIYAGEGKVIHFTRGAGLEGGTRTFLDRFTFSCPPSASNISCPECGDQSNLDGVISSCIDCFLSGGDLYLFHYGVSPAFFLAQARGGTCTQTISDPTVDVLHCARYLLQNGFGGYDIFSNNCENFAIYCKTGRLVGYSGQAGSFLAAVNTVTSSPLRYLATPSIGLSVGAVGIYCVRRIVSDIGIRRGPKIAVESLVTRSGAKK